MEYLQRFLDQIRNMLTWWVILDPWERGVRTRLGKNVMLLTSGIYFRIPLVDKVHIQSIRSRNISTSIQTISTKDGVAISIGMIIQYNIKNMYKMYNTLYHPEFTIQNIAIGELSNYISSNTIENCSCREIIKNITNNFIIEKYGLELEDITISTFAVVKTFRLIQDSSWLSEGYNLNDEKFIK